MKSTTDCAELIDLIPAYSIGATDADDTRRIEAALAGCPGLVDALAAYSTLTADLASRAPQLQAPAAILSNLLVATQPAVRVAAPLRRRLGWLAAAACVLLLITMNNLYWWTRIHAVEQRLIAVDAQVLHLPAGGSGEATGATAQAVWLPTAQEGILLASSFPAQTADTVYQAWVRNDGSLASLGTFQVDAEGTGSLVFAVAQVADGFQSIGITLEPLGGSPGPTSPPVVRWQALAEASQGSPLEGE